MTQLVERVSAVAEKVEEANFVSQADLQVALEWLHDGESSLTHHLADATGIQLAHGPQLGFLGVRKKVRERRRDLLRGRVADPAPWKSTLEISLADVNSSSETHQAIHRANFPKISDLRCPVHRRAPHVRLMGTSQEMTVEVEGCCSKLTELAHEALSDPKRA